jgi:two-component system, NarL family, nitrate/nitrite response regulator NarL
MFGVSRTMTIDARSCHSPIRVLVADDHALFRETLRTLLETDPDIVVVGDASSGRDAIRLTRDLQPDILLLDLVMPNVSGLETLRELSALGLATRTLLLTADAGDSDVVDALQLGARGVLMKCAATELLFKSIRTVMAGQYWVGRECVAELIDKMRERAATPDPEMRRPTFGLTPRELEVVFTVVDGYPNSDIARKFSISIKTVKHHLTNIFGKLGVSNRLELALFAVQHRLDAIRYEEPTRSQADSYSGRRSARLAS